MIADFYNKTADSPQSKTQIRFELLQQFFMVLKPFFISGQMRAQQPMGFNAFTRCVFIPIFIPKRLENFVFLLGKTHELLYVFIN